MGAGKFLLGAVIGMATGALLGILFAPEKGSTTRRKISKQGAQYMDDLKETAGEYVDALEGKIDNVRETAVDFTARARGAVDSLSGNVAQQHRT